METGLIRGWREFTEVMRVGSSSDRTGVLIRTGGARTDLSPSVSTQTQRKGHVRTQHSEEAAIGQPRRKFSETKPVGSLILDL